MVLGKLPVPGCPSVLIRVGQGPAALTVGVGGGCLDIFTLIYPFSPLSPFPWETARYRLKYCLKGPLNPIQLTNQPSYLLMYISLTLLNQTKHRLACVHGRQTRFLFSVSVINTLVLTALEPR